MQARLAQLKAIREAGLGTPHDLGKITQPVFVANGDNDVMVASSHSEDLARRIPDAKLTIYPDSGHGGVFQYHHEFVPAVVEFLEALSRPCPPQRPTPPTPSTRRSPFPAARRSRTGS